MEHYIYKITNNINGKFYYGKRSCKGLAINDKYMGSGIALKQAIIKYGKDNFSKEILAYCDSEEDVFELEELVVTMDEVDNPNCYNLRCGGKGGWIATDDTKEKLKLKRKGRTPSLGMIHSEEYKDRLRNQLGNKNPNYDNKMSEESKNKISETNKGKPAHNKGKPMTKDTKKKISESNKGKSAYNKGIKQEIVICPFCNKSGGINRMKAFHFENCSLIRIGFVHGTQDKNRLQ